MGEGAQKLSKIAWRHLWMTPYLNAVTLLVVDLEDVASLSRTGIPVDKAEPVGWVGRGRDGGPVDADLSSEVRTRLDLDSGSGWLANNGSGWNWKKVGTFCKA